MSKNTVYANQANSEKTRMQEFARRSIEKVGKFKDSYVGADLDKEDALEKHLGDAHKANDGRSAILEFEMLNIHCDNYFPSISRATPPSDKAEQDKDKVTR